VAYNYAMWRLKHATVGSTLLAEISGYVGNTDVLHATVPMQRYQFILNEVHLGGHVMESRALHFAEYAIVSTVLWDLL
jgi:hypothetical protein